MRQETKIKIKFWGVFGIVFALIMSRLLPHPDNFTPIVAAALFGGAYFTNLRLAFIVPLSAMLISDIALEFISPAGGFHDLMFLVYACFAGFVGLGILLRKYSTFYAPPLMATLAATLFFIITNFAVWLNSSFYPQTLEGLIACYIAALPFYGNSLAAALFWTTAAFGLWRLANTYFDYKHI